MFYILLIVFLFIFIYAFKIGIYWYFYKREPFFRIEKLPIIKLSLVIPFKDEEAHLAALISDLQNQTYQNVEILLINDHSSDDSFELAKQKSALISTVRLLNLPKNRKGKKQALAYAIEQSSADYIVTTDADCRLPKDWLYILACAFEQEDADLISAPVWMLGPNLFGKVQTMEFASLVASGAASIISQKPIMCNAANLAFKKMLYLENKEIYEQPFESGDDIMLLLSAKKQQRKIIFLKNQKTVIQTFAKKDWKDFIRQRQRWASKNRFYLDFEIIFVALLVFATNLSLFFLFFYSLKGFLLAYIIKSIPDFLLLSNFHKSFHKKFNFFLFLVIQLVYPFYILVSALGMLKYPQWKK